MGMSTGGQGGGSMLSEINVTPLVDVMLVLLIIFMVATPMIVEAELERRQIEMDLPVTRDNPDRVNPDEIREIILEINGQLQVFIGETMIADCSAQRAGTARDRFESCFEDVEKAIGANEKLKADGRLYLMADTEIPYGFVVGTMNRVRRAGVPKVGMVTNPEYLTDGR
jgi:biopolymer transport protein TolR